MSSGHEKQYHGALGESIAVRYLQQLGYKILDRNYAISGFGEIDIIAHLKGVIYFIEVKSSGKYQIGDENHSGTHFDHRKKERTLLMMRKYCYIHNISLPRSVGLLLVSFSRETKEASVSFDPHVFFDSI